MQEFYYIVAFSTQVDAVIPACFHVRLEGEGGCAFPGKVDLQGIEQEQDVPGKEQHPLPYPSGHAGHGYQELIEQG